MTKEIRSPVHGAIYSTRLEWFAHVHYVLFELRERWTLIANKKLGWADTYQYFKMLVNQRAWVFDQMQAATSWRELQDVINDNLDRMYAHPMTILFGPNAEHAWATRLAFQGGEPNDDASGCLDIGEVERDFDGPAYRMNARIEFEQHGKKRFKTDDLTTTLAAYGMLVALTDYQPAGEGKDGEHEPAHYIIEFWFLKKDWPNLPVPDGFEEPFDDEDGPLKSDPFDSDMSYFDDFEEDTPENRRRSEILESYKKLTDNV